MTACYSKPTAGYIFLKQHVLFYMFVISHEDPPKGLNLFSLDHSNEKTNYNSLVVPFNGNFIHDILRRNV